MRRLDELHTEWPFLGQRTLIEELRDQGIVIGRKRIRRLMKIMGMEAIAPEPSLSVPTPGHKIYLFLPSTASEGHQGGPSVVHGYRLYPNGARTRLPHRYYGLA